MPWLAVDAPQSTSTQASSVRLLLSGLSEERADCRGDHLRSALGNRGEDVADEEDPAAPPSRTWRTASTRPLWLSEMTRRTPVGPRSRDERRNVARNASVSLSPTMMPRTSRLPPAAPLVAITTARETIRWPT